jgi:hypothetical protein
MRPPPMSEIHVERMGYPATKKTIVMNSVSNAINCAMRLSSVGLGIERDLLSGSGLPDREGEEN